MCGIGALYNPRAGIAAEAVRAMQTIVRHRGPDDEGVACFRGPDAVPALHGGPDTPESAYAATSPYAPARGPVETGNAHLILTHRRLSILDLSACGHQPMCTPDRACWIVFNGEIYNYIELRAELKALGHAFTTGSDTEVILAAYREWGRDCVSRFNGMFTFVLFDRARSKLFAVRDRFGVKPLYYWVAPDGTIAFASEIKQFTVLPGWRARMNGQRVYDFINWALQDHTDETLFDGVYQLRGGEATEIEVNVNAPRAAEPGGKLAVYQWYSLHPRPFRGTFADAGDEFRRLLTDSVRLRLRADVPVGSCLSGGLDSSSIVCIMNDLLRAQDAHALQKTFSACATVKRFDERVYIDEVVRHTGTEAHYVYPTLGELFRLNERITHHQDEPFGSTSIYAQWHVFRLAAESDIKVMLDGQGADEQLAGYHNYLAPRFGSLLRKGQLLALWQELRGARSLHGYSLVWGIKQALNNLLPEPVRQPLRRLAGKPAIAAPWLDIEKLGAVTRDPFLEAGAAKAGTIGLMSRAQLAATSLPMLLHYEDRDSMAHSIEARVPFLDYRLVEFTTGLPDEFKLYGGLTKRVLREGMRGILPERIRNRVDKLGFVTPEEVWVRQEGSGLFRAKLRETADASNGVLGEGVMDHFERTVTGRQPFDFLLWRVISFGTWVKVFGVSR